MQDGEHLLALRLVQQRQPGEQLRKFRRFHRALPIDDDRVGPRVGSAVQCSSISNRYSAGF
jgi:hypothetical protein